MGGGVGGFASSEPPPRYFYSGPSGIMVVVPPAAPRLLLPLDDFVYGMADLEGVLYFVLPPAESLWAVPDDGDGGAAGMRQLVSDVGPEGAFAVDSRCLYWIDVVTSCVMMVHK
jgi:hypothetical protein